MNLNLHLPERKGLALEKLDDRSERGEFPAFDVNLQVRARRPLRRKVMIRAIERAPSRYL
jgi:hypothetical protein